MIKFPGENLFVQEINEKCEKQINFATGCLQLGLNISKIPEKNIFPQLALKTVLNLNIKNCRLFRSAIEMCQRGEALSAAIIVRVLFESVLLIKFVAEPTIQHPF